MNKTMYQFVATIYILIAVGCSPVYEDEDFFLPEKTNSYLLDNYTENTAFELDEKYTLNPALIHDDIEFSSFDGKTEQQISAVFVGDINQIDSITVIVFAADRKHNIDYNWPRVKLLAQLDSQLYGVLILDYRGFGKSTGSPSEAGIIADVDHALRWLKDLGLSDERLILYGYGLGSVPVLELSRNPRSLSPAKIVLEAPLASMEYLIQDATSLAVPGDYLSDLEFDNVSAVKQVTQPLMWIHGTNDKEYGINQGELIFENHPGVAGSEKFAYRIENATHHDLPARFDIGFDGYLLSLQTFFESQ